MTPEQSLRVLRRLYLTDLELGEPAPVEEYVALFPGLESEVRAALERMQEPSSRSAEPVEVSGSGKASEPEAQIMPGIGSGFRGAPGERLGRYRIERELGRGGQAIVYLAYDDTLSRRVALKILTRVGPGSEGLLPRFRREAEMASRLDHPGICTIFEAQVEGGLPFIAMQFVEGHTLAREITRRRLGDDEDFEFDGSADADDADFAVPDRAEVQRITRIFEGIARALHVAHGAGITHRDIKPGNVMIQEDDTPVILDFGLARDDEGTEMSLTRTGDFFGTPGYMSPEQLSAHRIRLDERTDIFSLGVALFEALASRRPFEAASREGVYQAILTKDPPDIQRFNDAVPRDLKIVLETALEKDRDRRYATAEDFAEELRRVRSFEPIVARPAGPWLRMKRWSQRNPGVAAMIALLLVVVGVGWAIAAANTNSRLARVEEERVARSREAKDRRFSRLTEQFNELAVLMETDPFSSALRSHEVAQIAVGLGAFEEQGLEFLGQVYRGEKKSEQVLSTQILSLLSGDEAFDMLAERVLSEDRTVATWASNGLVRRDHPDLERVCRDMVEGGSEITVRLNGAWGLCRLGKQKGVDIIRNFLTDANTDISFRMLIATNVCILRNETVRPLVDEIVERALKQRPLPKPLLKLAVGFYGDLPGPESRAALERMASHEALSETEIGSLVREALEALEDESTPD